MPTTESSGGATLAEALLFIRAGAGGSGAFSRQLELGLPDVNLKCFEVLGQMDAIALARGPNLGAAVISLLQGPIGPVIMDNGVPRPPRRPDAIYPYFMKSIWGFEALNGVETQQKFAALTLIRFDGEHRDDIAVFVEGEQETVPRGSVTVSHERSSVGKPWWITDEKAQVIELLHNHRSKLVPFLADVWNQSQLMALVTAESQAEYEQLLFREIQSCPGVQATWTYPIASSPLRNAPALKNSITAPARRGDSAVLDAIFKINLSNAFSGSHAQRLKEDLEFEHCWLVTSKTDLVAHARGTRSELGMKLLELMHRKTELANLDGSEMTVPPPQVAKPYLVNFDVPPRPGLANEDRRDFGAIVEIDLHPSTWVSDVVQTLQTRCDDSLAFLARVAGRKRLLLMLRAPSSQEFENHLFGSILQCNGVIRTATHLVVVDPRTFAHHRLPIKSRILLLLADGDGASRRAIRTAIPSGNPRSILNALRQLEIEEMVECDAFNGDGPGDDAGYRLTPGGHKAAVALQEKKS